MVMLAIAAAGVCRSVTIAAKLAFRPFPGLFLGYADDPGTGDLRRTLSLFVKLLGAQATAVRRPRHAAVWQQEPPHPTDSSLRFRDVCSGVCTYFTFCV